MYARLKRWVFNLDLKKSAFAFSSCNAFICKLSVGLYSAVKSDSELSAYPVSISKLTSELSVLLVVSRENIDGLVFPAPVLETVYALSVWCVSVSPRLQSLLWVPDRTVPSWCSSDPLWCSPAPPWRSPALSAPHWWAPALSTPSWRSPALSALHWWAPALSALPWRSSALSAPHWWAPALSAPPWRSSTMSALHWWASTLSAPPWRSPALSTPHWWVPALSNPPWRLAYGSGGLLLRSGDLLLCTGGLQSRLLRPGGLWSRHLGRLLCRLCLCSWSWHFLMDLSLPWFHLRSTALLDCSEFGVSGSGLCHKFGSWASFQLTTRGHSLTTWTLALH